MKYCPFCKTDKPFAPLREDALRERTHGQLKADLSYWTKELEKALDPARHYAHMKQRANKRVERIEEEIHRRAKNQRDKERKKSAEKGRKAA